MLKKSGLTLLLLIIMTLGISGVNKADYIKGGKSITADNQLVAKRFGGISLEKWLKRPHVRLLAVEFFGDFCEPCKKAIPAWKKLTDKYHEMGLRVVVVAVQSSGRCLYDVGWSPDEIICDEDGQISDQLKIRDLPQAYLWDFRGDQLVANGDVDHVKTAVENFFQKIPRVTIGEIDISKTVQNVDKKGLKQTIEGKLQGATKELIMVTDPEELKSMMSKLKQFDSPEYSNKGKCNIGEALSATSFLSVNVYKERNITQITLALRSAEKGCLLGKGTASVGKEAGGIKVAVDEAISDLVHSIGGEGGNENVAEGDGKIESNQQLSAAIKNPNSIYEGLNKIPSNIKQQDFEKMETGEAADKRKACKNGDGLSCTNLGYMYDVGNKGVPQDFNEAAKLYQKGCDLGSAVGCGNLGDMYVKGDGIEQNYNKGFALNKKGCEGNASEACIGLGYQYEKGLGVPANNQQAFTFYKKACDLNNSKGCRNSGLLHEKGLLGGVNMQEASVLYKKGCDMNDQDACKMYYDMTSKMGVQHETGEAANKRAKCNAGDAAECTNLGYMYDVGQGVAQNLKEAAALYTKACDLGNAIGCGNIGDMYVKGDGVQVNYKEGYRYNLKGCTLGASEACLGMGLIFEKARGVAENINEAMYYYKKSCEQNNGKGCRNLGLVYEYGKGGVMKNIGEAHYWYVKGCNLGHKDCCASKDQLASQVPYGYQGGKLGIGGGGGTGGGFNNPPNYNNNNNPPGYNPPMNNNPPGYNGNKGGGFNNQPQTNVLPWSAPKTEYGDLLEKRNKCNAGDAASCTNLGYAYDAGQGVARDLLEAAKLYIKGCELGSAVGCGNIGDMFAKGDGVPMNYQQGLYYNEKGCGMGGSEACLGAGIMHEKGQGTAVNYSEAMNRYEKCCNLNNGKGCRNLAIMYEDGKGVQKNVIMAMVYYKKGCDNKDQNSCTYYQQLLNSGGGGQGGGQQNYNYNQNQNYGQPQNFNEYGEAADLRKKCNNNDAISCVNLGFKYDTGQGATQSFPEAFKLYKRGCELGSAKGCTNAGSMLENGDGVAKNFYDAFNYYKKGCDGGDKSGCNNLGVMYDEGKGTTANSYEAFKLYSKACDQGSPVACFNMGRMYELGKGTNVNIGLSCQYYQKGCGMGDQKSCQSAQSKCNYKTY